MRCRRAGDGGGRPVTRPAVGGFLLPPSLWRSIGTPRGHVVSSLGTTPLRPLLDPTFSLGLYLRQKSLRSIRAGGGDPSLGDQGSSHGDLSPGTQPRARISTLPQTDSWRSSAHPPGVPPAPGPRCSCPESSPSSPGAAPGGQPQIASPEPGQPSSPSVSGQPSQASPGERQALISLPGSLNWQDPVTLPAGDTGKSFPGFQAL